VSCPEVKLCVAISQDNVLTTTDPTGGPSAWKSVDVGNALMGQAGDEFGALSCASASLCVVGDVSGNVLVSANPAGAASTWKVVDVDARASNAGISAVACPSVHFCVAGDDDGNILTTSDPRGGASAWKMVTPAGSDDSIHTLSCPSASFCIATGAELLTSTDPAGGASAWYSTSGVINDDAEAVTCQSLHLCIVSDVALDLATTAHPTSGLAAWANIYSAPNGPGNTMGIGLSCPAVDLCVITGDNDIISSTSPSAGAPVAPSTPTTIPAATTVTAAIDTASWREANFPSEKNGIVSVSCPSAGLCVAVDNGGNAFVSTSPYVGSTSAWKMSAVAGASSGFSGVSCPNIRMCVAIAGGNILTTTDPTGGGSRWRSLDAGNALMGQAGDEFESVSCPSPALCLVADINGNVLVSTNPTGPASAWKVGDVDARSASPEVTSLSCPSVHFCAAGDFSGHVLTTTDPTGGPGAWKTATPAGSNSSISSVSCPSSSFCVAASGQLFVSTDPAGGGHAWKQVSGVLNGDADTVACGSPTVCVASDVALDLATSSKPAGGAGAWTSSYEPPDSPRNSLGIAITCAGVKLCVATGDDDIISSTKP
jgi:putative hemolysin